MKFKIFPIMIFLCIMSGCKEKSFKNGKTRTKSNFPYNKTFSKEGHLSYDNETEIIIQKNHYSYNQPSKMHFLDLKNDTVIINSEQIKKLPSFVKDLFFLEDSLIVASTTPRTLGKNLKSTDILTKYDKDLNILLEKDMDISKYPSGNCLIVGDDNRLFYITDGYETKQNPTLVISEIDDSFAILNQKRIERKAKDAFRYDPIKSIFIKDVGLVVVSKLSYHNGNKPSSFKMEMFDVNLNKNWSQDLDIDAIVHLGYSKSKSKLFLVTEKDGNTVNFWDFKGNKQTTKYNSKSQLISIVANDDNIYILNNNPSSSVISKIDFFGTIISQKQTSLQSLSKDENSIHKLTFRENQLFLISIDNDIKLLTINKIKDNL